MPITGWASVGLQPTSSSTWVSSMSSSEFVAAPLPKTALSPVTEGLWQTRAQLSTLFVPTTARMNFCKR